MDAASQETLRRIARNDYKLRYLQIGQENNSEVNDEEWLRSSGCFNSRDNKDFSRLGAAIEENTHLDELHVFPEDDDIGLKVTNNQFFEGINRSSISSLILDCDLQNICGSIVHEILKVLVYQENNSQRIMNLYLHYADLQHAENLSIVANIIRCPNLQRISLYSCNITNELLLTIVKAVRCNRSISRLGLFGNSIGNAGCIALSTLLDDPDCSLNYLDLDQNEIGNEGILTIENSLSHNDKLQTLDIRNNRVDQCVEETFFRLLCNTSSIIDTYASNHTLCEICFGARPADSKALLEMNRGANKKDVAIKKILIYHPNMDMKPLFE